MSTDASERIALAGVRLRRGGQIILDQVDAWLGPGLYALVGANGAGKSTLLRALAGLVRPDRGQVRIAGHDLWTEPALARRALGYMPESPEFFPTLSPRELLGLVAAIRGGPIEPALQRFDRWVGTAALDLRVAMLSAGQRRKLALVLALLGEPAVLLLDEPVNTLDAAAVEDLRDLLIERRAAGRCVVVAIHHEATLGLAFDGHLRVADSRVTGP